MPAICFESPIPDLCKIQGLPMEPAANMTPLLHCAEKVSDFFLKSAVQALGVKMA